MIPSIVVSATTAIIRHHPQIPSRRFDEYQDFSLLEVAFLEQLAAVSPMLVAGDDDQGLYDFRGASPEVHPHIGIKLRLVPLRPPVLFKEHFRCRGGRQ